MPATRDIPHATEENEIDGGRGGAGAGALPPLLLRNGCGMEYLDFIRTNLGTAAVRRRPNAELLYYSQVRFRSEAGEWKRYHYYSREKDSFSSGLLESMYRNVREGDLPVEDWR
jgi:hypothetical protein